MSPSEIIALASVVATLVMGFLMYRVAHSKLSLEHEARPSPFRQKLFEEQLKAYLQVGETITRLWIELGLKNIIPIGDHGPLTQEERERVRQARTKLFIDRPLVRYEQTVILPLHVVGAIARLHNKLVALTLPPERPGVSKEWSNSLAPRAMISEACVQVVEAIRREAGVDALSSQVKELITDRSQSVAKADA
jgi:hypothetical protein